MPSKYEWDQLYKKLANAQDYLDFIRRLAEWDGTTDSWYETFRAAQREAKDILRNP